MKNLRPGASPIQHQTEILNQVWITITDLCNTEDDHVNASVLFRAQQFPLIID